MARMSGHTSECALLGAAARSRLAAHALWRKRVGGLGILPIGAGLIDRRGGPCPEGFRHDQQTSIQARRRDPIRGTPVHSILHRHIRHNERFSERYR